MQQMWQIREMMALAMLAVCAYTDIKERNIYIMPLLVPCIGSVTITLIGGEDLPEFLIFPALTGALVILVIKFRQDHMGMGDGYLMATLMMMIGEIAGLYVIMCSFAISSVYAGAVLLKKKGGLKREIPYAPFVMAGFLVMLTGEALRSKQHL